MVLEETLLEAVQFSLLPLYDIVTSYRDRLRYLRSPDFQLLIQPVQTLLLWVVNPAKSLRAFSCAFRGKDKWMSGQIPGVLRN